MPQLSDLPGEVLQQIHLYSLSPSLPLVNRFFRNFFTRASTGYAATYLLTYHHDATAEDLLSRALRHGVCDLEVLKAIEWRWRDWSERWEERERRRIAQDKEDSEELTGEDREAQDNDAVSSDAPAVVAENIAASTPVGGSDTAGEVTAASGTSTIAGTAPSLSISPENPYQALQLSKLNKRLFRTASPPINEPPLRIDLRLDKGKRKMAPHHRSARKPALSVRKSPSMLTPLIRYLFEMYDPSPNRDKGYPLCQAVLANNLDFVRFLLERGADPSLSEGLALQIALSRKDVVMVKLLMEEPPGEAGTGTSEGANKDVVTLRSDEDSPSVGLKRSRSNIPEAEGAAPSKKIKRCDRMEITPQLMKRVMQSGSRDIVDYFVQEKGYMPSLTSIMSWK